MHRSFIRLERDNRTTSFALSIDDGCTSYGEYRAGMHIQGTEVACLGAAGKRCLRFSSIRNGYYHSFGRTGLGAVMGSKMLKAVCFRSKGEIQVSDKKAFARVTKKTREQVMSFDPFGYTRRYGSMVVSDVYNRLGILPGYNFRQRSFDAWMLGYIFNTRGGDHLRIRTPADDLRDFERNYAYEPLPLTPTELDLVDIPKSVKDKVLAKPLVRIHTPSTAKYPAEPVVLLNSFGLCIHPPILRTVGPSLMAKTFNALYRYGVGENKLLAAAEKIINLQHLFNLEQGRTFADYPFPERFYGESVEYGKGRRQPLDGEEVKKTLRDYLTLRGWYQEGNVRQDTLTRLGTETWTKQ
jgi:aldehyde:ferredoxin oxidoreductase